MTASLFTGPSVDPLLAELIEEITDKFHAGQSLDLDAYVQQHPERADELRKLWPALQMLAVTGSSAGEREHADTPAEALFGVLGDFRIGREIGRGGMGVVYEAVQISLGRRVALKILPFAAALDSKQLQRFKNEAQAAAGLQHTNIVPVYFVGCERGVHFYAMQFVEGQTLAALIQELRQIEGRNGEAGTPAYLSEPRPLGSGASEHVPHAVDSPATGPYVPSAPVDQSPQAATVTRPFGALSTEHSTSRPAFFRTVANLGIQAGEALEHAHQLGVIHRDIKPANLMADARGNLWITDFGLAHCQSQAGLTMSGDLVGTLRYMSPEQALAKRVLVDHRTDIYSLGVTLYELLTLEPAFAGKDREELLRQIAFDDPNSPRRWNKAIPAELETIVLKAMEKNPADRYVTAQDLADDLERFLKDEPIRAKRPSPAQRAKKWMRRHQPVVWAAAVCLLVAVAALAGSLGWISRDQAARRTETEREANAALREAANWQQEGRIPEALAAARRAAWLVDTGPADEALRQRVQARLADLNLVADLEDARLQMTAVKEGHFDLELGHQLYADAFQMAGLDIEALPAEEAGERIRESSVAAEVVAVLDHWALTRQNIRGRSDPGWQHLLRVARAADSDDWRGRMRDALERGDRQALADLAGSKEVMGQSPLTLAVLGTSLQVMGAFEPAEAMLRQARQRHPGDFWANHELAWLLQTARPPRLDEAICFYTAAVAIRPTSPGERLNLGTSLSKKGRQDEAIAEYQEALRLKKDYPMAHYSLGDVLREKGRLDEAIAEYQKALRLKKDYPEAHNNLGWALSRQGKLTEAVAEYHEALRFKPDLPQARQNLADALPNLGRALAKQGKHPEAEKQFREAIYLKPDSAEAHCGLGAALWAMGRPDEAIAEYQKALRLNKDFPEAHNNLGIALADKGQLDEAIAEFREAFRVKKDYAEAHNNLGKVYCDLLGQPDKAIAEFREALRQEKDDPVVHYNLGVAYRNQGKLDEAIAEFREAVRLKKDHRDAHYGLGVAYRNQGKLDEAIAEFREALRLKMDHPALHNQLAWLLATCADLKFRNYQEAVELAKRAVVLAPKEGAFWNTLGVTQYRAGEWKAAVTALEKSMELRKGGDSLDWFFLAMAHQKLDHAQEARVWHAKAVQWMEKNQPKNEELGRFRAESEELLRIEKKAVPK